MSELNTVLQALAASPQLHLTPVSRSNSLPSSIVNHGTLNLVPETPPNLCLSSHVEFSFENLPHTGFTDLEFPTFFVHLSDPSILTILFSDPPLIELLLFVQQTKNEWFGPLPLTKKAADKKVRRKLQTKSLTFPLSSCTQIVGVVIPHDSFYRDRLYRFTVSVLAGDSKISSVTWVSDSFQIMCKKSAKTQKFVERLSLMSSVTDIPKISHELARRLASKEVSAVIGHQIITVQHLLELTPLQQVHVHQCIFKKKSQLTLERFSNLLTLLRNHFQAATEAIPEQLDNTSPTVHNHESSDFFVNNLFSSTQ
eukprot:c4894_g1_i1.p1 GENE.c4894_g1_i1~~c4894_g1_i1.p1  ORF type:complete len:326 (+),score=49.57 c4894_g1_i1:48-980(+)